MSSRPVMYPAEEQLAFHFAIGTAITQWAHVENNLYLIAYRCFGSNEASALTLASSFYAVENFRSKLAFVSRAFETTDFRDKFGSEWNSVRDEIQNLSSLRNAIAHGRLIIYTTTKPGRMCALVPVFGKESKIKQRPGTPPPGSLCVRDIDLAAKRFSRASSKLMSLYFRIGGEEDHYAEFSQREPEPKTLAQLRRQIYTMLPPCG
jgi:hypothetical protein